MPENENVVEESQVEESQELVDDKTVGVSSNLAAKIARLEKRLAKLESYETPESAVEAIDDLDTVEDYFDAIEGVKIQIDKVLATNKAAVKRAAESLFRANFLNGCPNCRKRGETYVYRPSKVEIMREVARAQASRTSIVKI